MGDVKDQASGGKIEIIRNIYRNIEGDVPSDFEVVAALAAIHGSKDDEDIQDAIKSHIEFLKAWAKLKETDK